MKQLRSRQAGKPRPGQTQFADGPDGGGEKAMQGKEQGWGAILEGRLASGTGIEGACWCRHASGEAAGPRESPMHDTETRALTSGPAQDCSTQSQGCRVNGHDCTHRCKYQKSPFGNALSLRPQGTVSLELSHSWSQLQFSLAPHALGLSHTE